ncbi:DUF551 domain-containing protein [Klebsiella pneumoniae]
MPPVQPVADSEPVAWGRFQETPTDGGYWILYDYKPNCSGVEPLYRHAQPAPDNRAITQHFDTIALETAREILCDVNRRHEFIGGDVQLLSRVQCRIDDACRAAMLQAEPVTTANKLPPNSFTDDELEGMAHGDNPRSNAYRDLLAYRRNSPVIPDTWIPVSERMPENKPGRYEYLVFEKLNNRVNHDYWNVPDAGDDTFTPFWNHYGEYVTHWMPLPASPQEVK